jgi:hypothetical protein
MTMNDDEPAAAEMKLEALARESKHGTDIGADGGSANLPGSRERVLKFELQMYKMRDGEYCIDIQVKPCLSPPTSCNLGSTCDDLSQAL